MSVGAQGKEWVSGGTRGKQWISGGVEGKQWVFGGAQGREWVSGGTEEGCLHRTVKKKRSFPDRCWFHSWFLHSYFHRYPVEIAATVCFILHSFTFLLPTTKHRPTCHV